MIFSYNNYNQWRIQEGKDYKNQFLIILVVKIETYMNIISDTNIDLWPQMNTTKTLYNLYSACSNKYDKEKCVPKADHSRI